MSCSFWRWRLRLGQISTTIQLDSTVILRPLVFRSPLDYSSHRSDNAGDSAITMIGKLRWVAHSSAHWCGAQEINSPTCLFPVCPFMTSHPDCDSHPIFSPLTTDGTIADPWTLANAHVIRSRSNCDRNPIELRLQSALQLGWTLTAIRSDSDSNQTAVEFQLDRGRDPTVRQRCQAPVCIRRYCAFSIFAMGSCMLVCEYWKCTGAQRKYNSSLF